MATTATLAYSTSTDGTVVNHLSSAAWAELNASPWDTDFCFVCGRATDHFAEHDDLVEQGLAEYVNGTPVLTPAGLAWKASL